MKKNLFIIAIIAITSLFTISCGESFTPERGGSAGSQTPPAAHVFTPEELFPNGDVLPFVIYPMDGWVIEPGQTLVFKALLLDEVAGVYKDVTHKPECNFGYSWHGGNLVNSDDPSLQNGQEIVIQAIYDKKFGAASHGQYVNNYEQ